MSISQHLKIITHIPKERLFAIAPVPKSAKIELTSRCNYKCQYCAISFRNGNSNRDMPWDLFKKITTEMIGLGVEEIGLFYIGESFTNPELLTEAVRFLKQELNTPYVFLTSNASLAKSEIVKDLMSLGLDSLKWSCNAADNEQFSELMGVSDNFFNLAKNNIRLAKRIRDLGNYKTGLYASSIKYNEEQTARMKPFIDDYVKPYVDEHYWLPLYTAGGQAKEREKALGMQPIAGNTGKLDDPAEPIPCWTIFTSAHVMVNGKLTACCLDGIGNWVMGDLKTQPFMEAWNSEEFVKLRQAHIQKNIIGTKCEKCALVV